MPRIYLRITLLLAAVAAAPPALATGVESRGYSCADLQGLVARQRFVFISNPDFQDYVVADRSFCGTSMGVQLRSVPTGDRPECPVNYCIRPGGTGS